MNPERDPDETAGAEIRQIREALDEIYTSEDSTLDKILEHLQADALREDW